MRVGKRQKKREKTENFSTWEKGPQFFSNKTFFSFLFFFVSLSLLFFSKLNSHMKRFIRKKREKKEKEKKNQNQKNKQTKNNKKQQKQIRKRKKKKKTNNHTQPQPTHFSSFFSTFTFTLPFFIVTIK